MVIKDLLVEYVKMLKDGKIFYLEELLVIKLI